MSHTANPYATQSVQTAGPATLVTMLYDRVLTAVRRCTRAAAEGPAGYPVLNTELQRAQDILDELRLSLNHETGGEIAGNLDALYGFCLDRVLEANLLKDVAPLDAVARIVGDLRAAWVQACDPASMADASSAPR